MTTSRWQLFFYFTLYFSYLITSWRHLIHNLNPVSALWSFPVSALWNESWFLGICKQRATWRKVAPQVDSPDIHEPCRCWGTGSARGPRTAAHRTRYGMSFHWRTLAPAAQSLAPGTHTALQYWSPRHRMIKQQNRKVQCVA